MPKIVYDSVRRGRILTLVLLDILSVNAAVLLSLVTRYEFSLIALEESGFVQGYFRIAPIYTLVALALFYLFRLYRSLWQYASVEELPLIILSSLLTNISRSE